MIEKVIVKLYQELIKVIIENNNSLFYIEIIFNREDYKLFFMILGRFVDIKVDGFSCMMKKEDYSFVVGYFEKYFRISIMEIKLFNKEYGIQMKELYMIDNYMVNKIYFV